MDFLALFSLVRILTARWQHCLAPKLIKGSHECGVTFWSREHTRATTAPSIYLKHQQYIFPRNPWHNQCPLYTIVIMILPKKARKFKGGQNEFFFKYKPKTYYMKTLNVTSEQMSNSIYFYQHHSRHQHAATAVEHHWTCIIAKMEVYYKWLVAMCKIRLQCLLLSIRACLASTTPIVHILS
jgi:hypothetical protein